MSSWPYQKLSEFPQETWDESTGNTRVAQVAIVMMVSEYCCVGAFFVAGRLGWETTATNFQMIFLALAATVEFVCYQKMGAPYGNEKVDTILAIPVKCLGIPKWIYMLGTLAPNYVHVISSALAAGVSYVVWQKPPHGNPEDLHDDHYRNWHDTPLIGHFVATHGIPDCLSLLVVTSMCCHVTVPILWFCMLGFDFQQENFIRELCDCANLQFLKKASYKMIIDEERLVQPSRLLLACIIKYPLLWAKTSFLAVMWEYMDGSMRHSMLVAVFLAWYGILQLMPTFFWQICHHWKFLQGDTPSKPSKIFFAMICVLTAMLTGGLLQQFLHLGGIWWCPVTHDFSLLHGRCTKAE